MGAGLTEEPHPGTSTSSYRHQLVPPCVVSENLTTRHQHPKLKPRNHRESSSLHHSISSVAAQFPIPEASSSPPFQTTTPSYPSASNRNSSSPTQRRSPSSSLLDFESPSKLRPASPPLQSTAIFPGVLCYSRRELSFAGERDLHRRIRPDDGNLRDPFHPDATRTEDPHPSSPPTSTCHVSSQTSKSIWCN